MNCSTEQSTLKINWDSSDSLAALTDLERESVLEVATLRAHAAPPKEPENKKAAYTFGDFTELCRSLDEKVTSAPISTPYFASLLNCTENCFELCETLDELEQNIKRLKDQYSVLSEKSRQLHLSCERLVDEQWRLTNQAEVVGNKLAYFLEVDSVLEKFPQWSTFGHANADSLLVTLDRLDASMSFLDEHPEYKEQKIYSLRLRQGLLRMLESIRTLVTVQLRDNASLVTQKSRHAEPDADCEADNAFTLLYGRFQSHCATIKSLMCLINNRLDKNNLYQQLMDDCLQAYLAVRLSLIEPTVSKALNDLASQSRRGLNQLTRASCSLMQHVYEDEKKLLVRFFPPTPATQAGIKQMLDQLFGRLYDLLRSRIVHVQHTETLSELCNILKMEMLEGHEFVLAVPEQVRAQTDAADLDDYDVPYTAFQEVCAQLLADCRERMVYCTHVFLQSEVRGFNPSPGDLAYPDKLEKMKEIAAALLKEGKAADNGKLGKDVKDASKSAADLHGMWYPTVRRCLMCLSRLHRCLDDITFKGLSQEVLKAGIESLETAASRISSQKSAVDGHLFLIKHLLILREQILPFRLDLVLKETSLDFRRIRDVGFGMLNSQSGKRLFALDSTNTLLRFLLEGTPEIVERHLDYKKYLDSLLKSRCEQLIADADLLLSAQVADFLNKVDTFQEMADKSEAGDSQLFRKQPFSEPTAVQTVVTTAYDQLKTNTKLIRESLSLYLSNAETEMVLFRQIRDRVQRRFSDLNRVLDAHYTQDDRQIIGCPNVSLMKLYHEAAKSNCLGVLHRINERDANEQDSQGRTPGHYAAELGNLDSLRVVVGNGGETDRPDRDGLTCLHLAAKNGHLDCVAFLVAFGANIWCVDDDLLLPIETAAKNRQLDVVSFLDRVYANDVLLDSKGVQRNKEKAFRQLKKRLKRSGRCASLQQLRCYADIYERRKTGQWLSQSDRQKSFSAQLLTESAPSNGKSWPVPQGSVTRRALDTLRRSLAGRRSKRSKHETAIAEIHFGADDRLSVDGSFRSNSLSNRLSSTSDYFSSAPSNINTLSRRMNACKLTLDSLADDSADERLGTYRSPYDLVDEQGDIEVDAVEPPIGQKDEPSSNEWPVSIGAETRVKSAPSCKKVLSDDYVPSWIQVDPSEALSGRKVDSDEQLQRQPAHSIHHSTGNSTSNSTDDSTDELLQFLSSLNLSQLHALLEKHLIDLEALALCSEADLQSIGVPLGPRRKILYALSNTTKL